MSLSLGNLATATPTDASDAELVSRAASGDGAAFASIMRRHNRMLFRTARSIVKDDAEAEDVVQEAYLFAWRALGRYRAESKLSTWLVRIAANEALARRRRKSAQIIPLEAVMAHADPDTLAFLADESGREPEQLTMRMQMRKLMEERIDLLPDAFRTVFILRAVEEMSAEEVARALQIPEATVRTRLFRARSLLREGLAREMDQALDDAFSFDGARCDRIVANVLAVARTEGLHGGE
ncbi:RNA polymerase sigma factor [Stenotrophomonas daejeonensis]|uniref:RNA polymerase sigma factor n=1 Tax=Stenotrophomonas daejeonensis TaxID=659018 RepID=A0A0R0E2P0_9GAMM|nr:RNA polymerase sigma factor [Stenotrophomonas daejeonensis]KRG84350.1 RNA polymerase sigma factor [Stenotrophomonas daejeonensis]